jgi:hypothetical protein
MIRPATGTRQYRICVRSDCGRLLASLIDSVQVERCQHGGTCVVASVRDDPEFWGLMEQLRDLALHVVSVQDLDHANGRAAASWAGSHCQ